MSMDVAKRFIDMILEDNDDTAEYIDSKNSIAVIMEFIGGEPLLQIDLIDDIITYFVEQMILLDHPWQYHYMISICSNGVLYFDPKWQAFMKKHWNHLSFNISIDGNKQLHDACRVFPDGSGSYDKAIAGVRHFVDVLGGQMGSKMTLAPQNIQYTCDAVKGLIASGYKEINLNCVFEKGWTEEHATILYYQLKELADYIIDNNLDVYISMFEQSMFHPKDREDRQNWCWGAGTRILTSAGLVPIEEITIGTMVMTEDGSYHPVIQTMHHMADNCVKIFDKFVCTDDHKLYVYNEYFSGTKPIKDILETDNIKTYSEHTGFGHLSGHWMEASYVEPQEVYNITVDTNHSYIAEGLVSANCGGNGQMISVDWKGDIYPCIRYMESSLGNDVPPLIIGNVYDGILTCSEHKECARCLKAVDRITQSTEECIDCAIAEGCAWCFPAGTKIRLPYNYKNIEDIEIGDIVLDNNGLPQKVENIISRKAKKDELIYIHAAGVKDLLTTKEHPFLALPVEKKHNNYPIYAKEPKWVKACDLKTTDRIALFMPKIGNEDFDLTKAYLIGRYVGDGYKTGSNRTKHPYRYYITCAFDEQDELEEKFNLLPNLKFTKSSQRTVFAYNIPITNNEDMINILEDCGRDSLTKRVPEAVYGWKKECIEAFLKGYFDADGDFDTAKQIQRYSTSSSDLAYGIAELIRMVYHKNVNFTYIILKPKTIIEGREVN